jgi:hypothetical protein
MSQLKGSRRGVGVEMNGAQEVGVRVWRCDGVTDLGQARGRCGACNRERVRFMHKMTDPESGEALSVGRVCAGRLEGDPEAPVRRERGLLKRSDARKRWVERGWLTSRNEVPYRRVEGRYVRLFRRGFGRWAFTVDGAASRETYESADAAKLAAFESLYPSSSS